jgi:hypothetical protein
MRTGSAIFALLTLIVGGVILADVLSHRKGTATVFTGLGHFTTASYNAMLGRGVTPSGKAA